ncbi:MAG: outer membrane lipoprotein SlyB [Cryomorphaceae bacterium]|jgi:outer membrane lipoprotein SlyB
MGPNAGIDEYRNYNKQNKVTTMLKSLTIIILCATILSACASNSRVVSRDGAYRSLTYGAVLSREQITIGGSDTGIGAYVVSAAAIHDATSNSFLGFIVRGLAGALVGAVAEEAITRKDATLYTIETSQGDFVEIASSKTDLSVGSCVRISDAGRRNTRIKATEPANCADFIQQTASTVS